MNSFSGSLSPSPASSFFPSPAMFASNISPPPLTMRTYPSSRYQKQRSSSHPDSASCQCAPNPYLHVK